jgi:hypothetical protein
MKPCALSVSIMPIKAGTGAPRSLGFPVLLVGVDEPYAAFLLKAVHTVVGWGHVQVIRIAKAYVG